jgi:hypothetical protein
MSRVAVGRLDNEGIMAFDGSIKACPKKAIDQHFDRFEILRDEVEKRASCRFVTRLCNGGITLKWGTGIRRVEPDIPSGLKCQPGDDIGIATIVAPASHGR